jgi:rhomboid protease GluP
VLQPAVHAILDQVERDVRHDATYTVTLHGVRARPILTWVLIAASCAMFLVEMQLGGSQNPITLLRLGAATSHPDFDQWWRLIAANFLHFGLAHLLMNMLALRALGPFIEQFLGRLRYAILYVVSGIGAIAGTLWVLTQLDPEDPGFLVGASGAIMGLVGANGAIFLRGWLKDHAAVAGRRLRVVLIIVALQVVFDALTPQVSGTAHLIGLGIGFLITLLLMIGMGRDRLSPSTG